ncbi:MAG: hypothetical protein AAF348_09995 [Bacteroidota bacterium]
MKKIILTALICGMALKVKSQNLNNGDSEIASVEKSVFGIQTGFAGLWFYNELALSSRFALRTEVGLDAYDKDDFYPDTGFLLATVLTLEPRWYYNLNKRKDQSKPINGNSGNFFSLKSSLRLENLLIKFGEDDVEMVNNLSIVPTWGMRRSLGKHFNYEAGVGIGYVHFFAKDAGFSKDEGEVAINLHLRIGYRF